MHLDSLLLSATMWRGGMGMKSSRSLSKWRLETGKELRYVVLHPFLFLYIHSASFWFLEICAKPLALCYTVSRIEWPPHYQIFSLLPESFNIGSLECTIPYKPISARMRHITAKFEPTYWISRQRTPQSSHLRFSSVQEKNWRVGKHPQGQS